jgi:hypothetical protein
MWKTRLLTIGEKAARKPKSKVSDRGGRDPPFPELRPTFSPQTISERHPRSQLQRDEFRDRSQQMCAHSQGGALFKILYGEKHAKSMILIIRIEGSSDS